MHLITVLQRDLGVRFNPACMDMSAPPSPDPADNFIHGITEGQGGTCASLPVLYVAVGRRLGYPLKLVRAAAHLFCRWDGDGERFNIEGTNRGVNFYPDEYYLTFPHPMTVEEAAHWGFLRSCTPREELSLFIGLRGSLLHQTGRYREAAKAFAAATTLAPEHRGLEGCMLVTLEAWEKQLTAGMPAGFPVITVRPQPRRYPGIAERVEQAILVLETVERLLGDSWNEMHWWEPMRRRPGWLPPGLPRQVVVEQAGSE
jgi:hypothetical protein